MSTPIQSQVIDPKALRPAQKQALIAELHAAHAEIFDGVSRQKFAAYVIDSPADRTRVEVFRSAGRVVGYIAVHTFVREIDGQRWVVLRAESGKLAGFRRSANGALMIREVLRACLRYPGARKAFLGCFVHPSAYLAMGHVAPAIYPHWSKPTPAPIQNAMDLLAADFGLEGVEGGHAGVRKVGWITRESDLDRASWARREDPITRFYLEQNPGYRKGDGLVIFVPLSLRSLVEGSARHLRRGLQRRLSQSVAISAIAPRSEG